MTAEDENKPKEIIGFDPPVMDSDDIIGSLSKERDDLLKANEELREKLTSTLKTNEELSEQITTERRQKKALAVNNSEIVKHCEGLEGKLRESNIPVGVPYISEFDDFMRKAERLKKVFAS